MEYWALCNMYYKNSFDLVVTQIDLQYKAQNLHEDHFVAEVLM